jgi:hypothetical protein
MPAPRVLKNTVNGVAPGADVVAPPPSQLISRRPLVKGPAALALLGLPKAARNASTVGWIEPVVALPPKENGTKAAMLASGAATVMAATMSEAVRPVGERITFDMIYAPLEMVTNVRA